MLMIMLLAVGFLYLILLAAGVALGELGCLTALGFLVVAGVRRVRGDALVADGVRRGASRARRGPGPLGV